VQQPEASTTARVVVVDDSAFYRQALVMMLKEIPGVEVVGTATDGLEAIQAVNKYRPTLITLDLEMPRMDGFGFLRWLMRTAPTPVLVISAASDASNVFQALDLGAADFLAKPTHLASWEILKVRQDLQAKVSAIVAASTIRLCERAAKAAALRMSEPAPIKPAAGSMERLKLVAIGSSTGGPAALVHCRRVASRSAVRGRRVPAHAGRVHRVVCGASEPDVGLGGLGGEFRSVVPGRPTLDLPGRAASDVRSAR
jgi:two-component system chemotaxis response regulator CheB